MLPDVSIRSATSMGALHAWSSLANGCGHVKTRSVVDCPFSDSKNVCEAATALPSALKTTATTSTLSAVESAVFSRRAVSLGRVSGEVSVYSDTRSGLVCPPSTFCHLNASVNSKNVKEFYVVDTIDAVLDLFPPILDVLEIDSKSLEHSHANGLFNLIYNMFKPQMEKNPPHDQQ